MTLPVAILCGGLGTRLLPLTEALPKSLVPVNGEPFLAHQLRLLKRRGVSRVVLLTGHLGEPIRAFAGDGGRFGLSVAVSPDGPVPLGTAGAVRRALPLLGPAFFVLYGDSYLTCDHEAVGRSFEEAGRLALMTVYRNDGRFVPSNAEFDGGRLLSYDKERPSPGSRHVDYGLGVFRREAFEAGPADGAGDLADLYRALLAAGQLAAREVPGRFFEAGSIEGLAELEAFLAAGGDR